MDLPPPIPPVINRPTTATKKETRRVVIFILLGVLVAGFCIWSVVHAVVVSGITRGPDNMFGDQHLKTAVALIELHKVRFGRYPDSLHDLKFTGQWDQIALQSVLYYPNTDHTAYYIEVQRGWIGKPTSKMPAEFWKGTGFSEALKTKSH